MPCVRSGRWSVALLPSKPSKPYLSNTAESLVPAKAWLGLVTSDLAAGCWLPGRWWYDRQPPSCLCAIPATGRRPVVKIGLGRSRSPVEQPWSNPAHDCHSPGHISVCKQSYTCLIRHTTCTSEVDNDLGRYLQFNPSTLGRAAITMAARPAPGETLVGGTQQDGRHAQKLHLTAAGQAGCSKSPRLLGGHVQHSVHPEL